MKLLYILSFASSSIIADIINFDNTVTLPWNLCLKGRLRRGRAVTTRVCKPDKRKFNWQRSASGGLQLIGTQMCVEVENPNGNNYKLKMKDCADIYEQKIDIDANGNFNLPSGHGHDDKCIIYTEGRNRNIRWGPCPIPDEPCNACVMSFNSDGSPGKVGSGVCTIDEDTGKGQYCHCSNSLYGRYCAQSTASEDPNYCDNCSSNSSCQPDPQFGQYWCECDGGYTGEFCQDRIFLLDCVSGTCHNGHCVAQTNEGDDGFYCQCDPGFKGAYCGEVAETEPEPCNACVMTFNPDGSPGKVGSGVCTVESTTGKGQYCKCSDSLYGRHCAQSNASEDPDYCINCSNHSTCQPSEFGQFWCECHEGYTGQFCNDRIFLLNCESDTCHNGHCVAQTNAGDDGFYCECDQGFGGAYCE